MELITRQEVRQTIRWHPAVLLSVPHRVREADEYRAELNEEKASHARTRESTMAEMREIIAMRDEAEVALTEAEKELPGLRAQLEHVESSLRAAEEEKANLEYQATNFEAEIQRAKSMQRFLESQVAEGYVVSSAF